MGGKGGRIVKEDVKRTHGQSQRGVGSRVGGGDGWSWGSHGGKMETTVRKHQFKKRKKKNYYKE